MPREAQKPKMASNKFHISTDWRNEWVEPQLSFLMYNLSWSDCWSSQPPRKCDHSRMLLGNILPKACRMIVLVSGVFMMGVYQEYFAFELTMLLSQTSEISIPTWELWFPNQSSILFECMQSNQWQSKLQLYSINHAMQMAKNVWIWNLIIYVRTYGKTDRCALGIVVLRYP